MLKLVRYRQLKKGKMTSLLLGLIIFSFFLLGFWGKLGIVKTKVSKNKVETGEIFTYTITVRGEFDQATLFLPEFENFKIVSQNESKSYSIRGTEEKVALNLTYQLFAPEAGVFTIEGAILKENDRRFKGNPITIEVKGRSLQEKKKILPYIEKGIDL
ncbi:MAG: BatD family protein [Candidatus Omnitrophota bacterium]|nr:MAG: BatD family protein [Candidatus Omnitrophota bacterium]